MSAQGRLAGLPWVTAGVATLLLSVFLVQQSAIPPACASTAYPALCLVEAFAENNVLLWPLVAPFLHASWTHLLLNVGMVALFGSTFERVRDRTEYGVFLVISAYLSIDAQLFGAVLVGDSLPLVVGASGTGYALAGFTATFAALGWRARFRATESGSFRRGRTSFRALLTLLALLVVLEALAALWTPSPVATGTQSAELTHLVGLGIGIVWGTAVGVTHTKRSDDRKRGDGD